MMWVKLQIIMFQFINRLALICMCGSLTVFAVACQGSKDKSASTQKQQLSPSSFNANEGSKFIDESFLDRSIASLESPTTVTKLCKTGKCDYPKGITRSDRLTKVVKYGSTLKSAKGINSNINSSKDSLLFDMGLTKAKGAFSISQSSKSIEDWKLVASMYRDAIALMREVKKGSPEYIRAKNNIKKYQRQINYARGRIAFPRAEIANTGKKQVLKTSQNQVSANTANVPLYSQARLSNPVSGESRLKSSSNSLSDVDNLPKVSQDEIVSEAEPLSVTNPVTANSGKKYDSSSSNDKSESESQSTQLKLPLASFNEKSSLNARIQDSGVKVFAVPIKKRIGGTPIIEVTFNGEQTFDMIVDTGASGTVITEKMAKKLGVDIIGKAQANTASAKSVEFPIGMVKSIEVAGARANKVAVAIAGNNLEVGLLGHDFFGDYDLTIKRDSVEFRTQVDERIITNE